MAYSVDILDRAYRIFVDRHIKGDLPAVGAEKSKVREHILIDWLDNDTKISYEMAVDIIDEFNLVKIISVDYDGCWYFNEEYVDKRPTLVIFH